MRATPTVRPFTQPACETVATPASRLEKTMARPASGWLLASRASAASCTESPVKTSAVAGESTTEATGTGTTRTTTLSNAAPAVARMTTRPSLSVLTTPVLAPVLATVASVWSDVVQTIGKSGFSAGVASYAFAESESCWPMTTSTESGDAVTEATGRGSTLILTLSFFPSGTEDAMIHALSRAIPPFTQPFASTETAVGLELVQVTARPVSRTGGVLTSNRFAVTWIESPRTTVDCGETTATDATGAWTVTSTESAIPVYVRAMTQVVSCRIEAVSLPSVATAAALTSREVQPTWIFESWPPDESLPVTESCCVAPPLIDRGAMVVPVGAIWMCIARASGPA